LVQSGAFWQQIDMSVMRYAKIKLIRLLLFAVTYSARGEGAEI